MTKIKLEEIARMNMSDAAAVEEIRRRLGLTQGWVAEAIGITGPTYNYHIKQNKELPERFKDPILNVFTAAHYARQAIKVLPVNGKDSKTGQKESAATLSPDQLTTLVAFLEEVAHPRISVFEEKEVALLELTAENARLAKKVLERLKPHIEQE